MSLMQNIKNYLTNFSGISWNKETNRYDVKLDPNEDHRNNRSNDNSLMFKHDFNPDLNKKDNPGSKQEPMVYKKDIKTGSGKDKEEFDYTYGGRAKFNTRDLLNENESYRDTVYTNYFKDKKGNGRYDVPTIGYGQTLGSALGNKKIELVDKNGNKKTQTGKEWNEELSKQLNALPQGSGKRKGKRYDSDEAPIEWRISDESMENLTRETSENYLNKAKKVADDYAKTHGSQYAWDNLSPLEQMQVYQAQYGGSFRSKDTSTGSSIPKATIHLDMKRAGIDPEKATDKEYEDFIEDWYKKNAPRSGSSKIIRQRALKTRNYYQQRNCKKVG